MRIAPGYRLAGRRCGSGRGFQVRPTARAAAASTANRADDLAPLFADLSIWQAGESYRAHFQRYPVIFLTLKGIKLETFDLAWDVIRKRLAGLFSEHRALLDS